MTKKPSRARLTHDDQLKVIAQIFDLAQKLDADSRDYVGKRLGKLVVEPPAADGAAEHPAGKSLLPFLPARDRAAAASEG